MGKVASFMGAWIEILTQRIYTATTESHPLWVRGLKLLSACALYTIKEVASFMGAWIEMDQPLRTTFSQASHPLWVRGLKSVKSSDVKTIIYVASFMGAWIEIARAIIASFLVLVASFMGAWIEILSWVNLYQMVKVASFMGAWIEICPSSIICWTCWSHPLWVRGLKFIPDNRDYEPILSHPLWVRGLKYEKITGGGQRWEVASFMGAWIEIHPGGLAKVNDGSHPLWVRGLKFLKQRKSETLSTSHPLWVRGLKYFLPPVGGNSPTRRILYGCVD